MEQTNYLITDEDTGRPIRWSAITTIITRGTGPDRVRVASAARGNESKGWVVQLERPESRDAWEEVRVLYATNSLDEAEKKAVAHADECARQAGNFSDG